MYRGIGTNVDGKVVTVIKIRMHHIKKKISLARVNQRKYTNANMNVFRSLQICKYPLELFFTLIHELETQGLSKPTEV